MIKPDVWIDEGFLSLTIPARLLWIGIISGADDEGRGLATDRCLKALVFPGDEITLEEVRNMRSELAKNVNVLFYEAGGREYYQLTKWRDHQKVEYAKPSTLPKPELEENSKESMQKKEPRMYKRAIPAEVRRIIARRYGVTKNGDSAIAKCAYCEETGLVIQTNDSYVYFADLEIDHVMPESKGGTEDPENLVLSCVLCNRKKYDKLVSGGEPPKNHLGSTYNELTNKSMNTEMSTSPSAPARKTSPVQFSFETGLFRGISDGQVSRWCDAYPALEIETELAKAAAWLQANPAKKKKNYGRFIVNWLSRAQEKGGDHVPVRR